MVISLSTKAIIVSKIGLAVINNLNKKDKILLTLQDIFKLAEIHNIQINDLIYFYNLANIFIKTKMFDLVKEIYINDTRIILFDTNFEKYKNTIFYFHGGAYCAGSPEIYYDFLKNIDEDVDSTNFILIDYKKLLEYNIIQIINSTFNVYNNLIDMINNQNIIFMGDSAGANLALQVTNLAIKQNKNIPSNLICLSPWIITNIQEKYWNSNKKKDYLTPYTISIAKDAVLNSADYTDYNPLDFNYNNFPKMLIRAGSNELILDEIYALIDKVKKSNCIFEYQIVNNMYHSFDLYYTFSKSKSPDYDKLIYYLKNNLQ